MARLNVNYPRCETGGLWGGGWAVGARLNVNFLRSKTGGLVLMGSISKIHEDPCCIANATEFISVDRYHQPSNMTVPSRMPPNLLRWMVTIVLLAVGNKGQLPPV